MTANVIDFPSRGGAALTLTEAEAQEIATWAARCGAGWSATRLPSEDRPGTFGMCVQGPGAVDEDDEWFGFERCDAGVGLFYGDGETIGIFPNVAAALAAI